ncbi:MAG: hypothetical protein Q4A74_08390 [Cardiobacteriaceae bacterium]|nr:hypothetical protein [Cardiobacteriaceae bacterium]
MTNLLAQLDSFLPQFAPQYKRAVQEMKPVIERLLQHYQNWYDNRSIEEEDQPATALLSFIKDFDIHYPATTSVKRLKIALRTIITELKCFRYRTFAVTENDEKQIDTWQPLAETFTQFCERCKERGLSLQQRGIHQDPYPPEDMIISWVDRILREDGNSVYIE